MTKSLTSTDLRERFRKGKSTPSSAGTSSGKPLPPGVKLPVTSPKRPEQRAQLARLRAFMEAGEREDTILDELRISETELASLKRRMYAEELITVAERPVEETYIDYRFRMEGAVRDLGDISREARGASQFTAAMGAVKAKAAIIDKVVERGQDMGVIPRAAKRHEVVGGLMVATLTDKELIDQIAATSQLARELHTRYGSGQKLIELAAPEVYSGPVLVESEPERRSS